MALPGDAGGVWPFPSVEADLAYKEGVLRVRKFKAARDTAALRLSGSLDTRKRIASAKASGELDIAGWIAAGAPGVSYVRRVVREGKAEFSATADGPWNDPEGAARLVFRNAGHPGAAGAEGEAQLSLRGRVLRLTRAHAKLWGGVLEADGQFRTDSGHVEGKASLRRVSLAAVPWESLGVPVSLAGTGDVSVRVAGTSDRLEGAVSLALPGGIERISSPAGERFGTAVPDLARGGRFRFRRAGRKGRFVPPAGGEGASERGRRGIDRRGDASPARFIFPPRREGGRLRRRRTACLGKDRRRVGILRPLVPPARKSGSFRDRARDSRDSPPSDVVEDRRRAVGGAPDLDRRPRAAVQGHRRGNVDRSLRSVADRFGMDGRCAGDRPLRFRPLGRGGRRVPGSGRGRRVPLSRRRRGERGSGREDPRRGGEGRCDRRGSRPRVSTSAGSRCGPCGRRGSSRARNPPTIGKRMRRGNSATARFMSRRTATAETGLRSRERWRGSRSPRRSPCFAATIPGK